MNAVHYQDNLVTLHHGDCRDVLASLPDGSVDSIVTDPPYELGFMGRGWDSTGIAYDVAMWRECLRVLKPGGHLLSFGASRTFHRMAVAVEDAGFEIRDSIAWLYGSGFPKSLDVAKAIDKADRGVPQGGADPTSANHGQYRTTKTEGKRWENDSGQSYGAGGSAFLTSTVSEKRARPTNATSAGGSPEHIPDATALSESALIWQGWGTALKPAFEPIVVARKPFPGTVASNVLAHGTGALNIDASRVATSERMSFSSSGVRGATSFSTGTSEQADGGRWPSNVVLDESQAAALDLQSGLLKSGAHSGKSVYSDASTKTTTSFVQGMSGKVRNRTPESNEGHASRFFPTFRYEAKAPGSERPDVDGKQHPTVKPLDLMRWLVRLVTPPGGVVLEPFAGSGTTIEAALLEGFSCIAVEMEADHLPLIMQRISKPLQQSLFGEDVA